MDADEDAPAPPLPPPAAAGRPGAVHIADVAAVAGVSIATVSRALANPGRVNAATRERVLEVVRRLGYTPNLAGRRLRAARSMMVLVVVPTFITPFFSELLLGVDQALSARGYGLLVGNLHGGVDKEEHLIDLVFAGGADGVVLLNGRVLHKGVRSLGHSGVPMVAVSVPPSADVPQVLVGEREAAAAVAEHLLALGHRRFGYVTGPEGSYIERERWAGYSEALAGAGIRVDTIARYPGSFHVASGVQAARRFLAEPERPSAVFAVSDMMAIAFMRTVHAAGLIGAARRLGRGLRRHRVRRLLRAAAHHRAPAARGDGARRGRAAAAPDRGRGDPASRAHPAPRSRPAPRREHRTAAGPLLRSGRLRHVWRELRIPPAPPSRHPQSTIAMAGWEGVAGWGGQTG